MAESTSSENKFGDRRRWQSRYENLTIFVTIVNTLPALAIFIAFPIAVYQTISFDTNKDIAIKQDRPYDDAPYFAGNDFHNEFGKFFGIIVVLHVATGFLANLFIFIPLIITKKGSFYHQTFGALVLFLISLLYLFGESDEVILLGTRGYHPCAHGIETQNHATSFSYLLFLQFTYYGPFLAETVCYGTLLIVYRKSNNDNNMPDMFKYILVSLSVISITLNIARLFVLLSIMIVQLGEDECDNFGYNASSAFLLFFVMLLLEWPSSILSFTNCRYITLNLKGADSEYDYEWKTLQHGKNLAVASVIVTWTLYVNIFGKLKWQLAVNALYGIDIIIIYVYCVDIFRKKFCEVKEKVLGKYYYKTETKQNATEMIEKS